MGRGHSEPHCPIPAQSPFLFTCLKYVPGSYFTRSLSDEAVLSELSLRCPKESLLAPGSFSLLVLFHGTYFQRLFFCWILFCFIGFAVLTVLKQTL